MEDLDVCYEESEIDVDIPGVVSSAELVSDAEETATENMDVCEESEILASFLLLDWCLFPGRSQWV